MTDPLDLARLKRATADLHEALAQARGALDRSRPRLAPSRAELGRLQADARNGRLGPELRELAGHVVAGDTSWLDVFAGTSPYAALLGPHLTRMAEQHAASVARALAEDPNREPDVPAAPISRVPGPPGSQRLPAPRRRGDTPAPGSRR